MVRQDEETAFNEACELIWQRAMLLDGSVDGRNLESKLIILEGHAQAASIKAG